MYNIEIMQILQTPNNLYKDVPNFSFRHKSSFLLLVDNFIVQVTSLSNLHDNAQRGS